MTLSAHAFPAPRTALRPGSFRRTRPAPAWADLIPGDRRVPQESAWSLVRGIEPLSLCDWPGKNASVIFLAGCDLRCPTCQNAELAWDANALPPVSRSRAMIHLAERGRWLDGVVVTGGEPTLAPGLADFLADLQRFRLPVKLDTNGMRPDVVREVLDLGLADLVAVDVKGPFDLYPELTGQTTDPATARARLTEIFDLAAGRPGSFHFRTTAVPLLDAGHIEAVRRLLPPGHALAVQQYKKPRRLHAQPHPETGRQAGNVVHGPHRPGHSQGLERQWHQGPPAG